jgi:hypothetical protein
MRRPSALWTLLVASWLSLAGCDWIQDRFRTCGHVDVELQNSEQSLGPVAIMAEGEVTSDQFLLASGASRRMSLCVERGDAKRFRVVRAGETVAQANCVVSRARNEYEFTVMRVVWDARGLVCENW